MRAFGWRECKRPEHGIDEKERLRLVRQYGSFTLAYSATVQPDMSYFGGEDGFLAYKQVGATAFVLSNPVAPRSSYEDLIRRFTSARTDVCFWQVSRPVAEILAQYGFCVSEMGIETWIALDGYDFGGPRKRNFRRAINRAARCGFTITERPVASLDREELNSVSERWRQTRKVKDREMTFLTRPAVLDDEVDVRKFFAFSRDGKLQAFTFFDPIYENGRVAGYLCSAKRRLPETDPLVGYALLHRAIITFRNERRRVLSFGLSPLCCAENEDGASGLLDHATFRRSHVNAGNVIDFDKLEHALCEKPVSTFSQHALVAFGFRLVYRNRLFNRFIYPLQGFAIHKGSFGGSAEPVYCALKRGFVLPQLLKMPRACSMA